MTSSSRLSKLVALAVLAAGAGACSRPAATEPTTVPASSVAESVALPPTTTTIALPADVSDVVRMPLTGQPLKSEQDIPQRPAVIVKIPMDDPAAMPHTGLNQADIVFQTVINDSFSRLIAVFHSQSANPVGPIRSGRDQDIPIVAEFQRPLVGWSGGNPGVNRVMRKADADGLLIDLSYVDHPELFKRRSDRGPAPHNLFTSTDALWSMTPPEFELPLPVFPYLEPGVEPDGDAAEEINVALDSVRSHWEYDPKTGRYYKWNNDKPHMTEADQQVWADNVVVVIMDYGVSPIDASNPLAKSLGSNPVYVFSRGKVRVGEWVRFVQTEGWGLYDNLEDLDEIGLVSGRTWVEVPRQRLGVLSYKSGADLVKPDTAPTTTTAVAPGTTAAKR